MAKNGFRIMDLPWPFAVESLLQLPFSDGLKEKVPVGQLPGAVLPEPGGLPCLTSSFAVER
jgi:hypothetical protein